MTTLARRSDTSLVGAAPVAAELLNEARYQERSGCYPEAIERYEGAIALAEQTGEHTVRIEALRCLAVVRYQRGDAARAQELCRRSYEAAREAGDNLLAARALNTLGGLDLSTGSLEPAQRAFTEALELAGSCRELHARVQQNLGILANIRGELDEAVARYERSLAAYRDCGDEHGCATTYHNLAMVSLDRGQLAAAECYFREARALAQRIGDMYLEGLCLVNHAEVDVARQRFESARQSAEEALATFDQLGACAPKADAYRVLGMVYRETGRPTLAESRFRAAIELAVSGGAPLAEAEASHELAILYQTMGRNGEALRLLHAAHELFRRVDARAAVVHVGARLAELKGTYLAVVREWGRSIESSDVYTYGHCERVARLAAAMARVLGFDEEQETTVLLGAYLHDLGKLRIPHEILRKPGPLSPDERAVIAQHPLRGLELLKDVEFPWDLKAIIRWHHERVDGSGYPDGLSGDAIPLTAQIVGLADFYDALASTRPEHTALPVDQAIARIEQHKAWWSEPVMTAFLTVVRTG